MSDKVGAHAMRASIVVKALNEAVHPGDLLKMIDQQVTPDFDVEVVLIDSGSTDGTVEIAQSHGARITTISRSEFSFGSERRIFAKYFPKQSNVPQQGFFCNNANSAITRAAWKQFRFVQRQPRSPGSFASGEGTFLLP